jgi:hypothetical protein
MPLADSSLALAPTLTTSTRPLARSDATALTALPPLGTVASAALVPGPAATLPTLADTRLSPGTVPILPAALTSVLIPAIGDFSGATTGDEATFVGLNAFLDVNSFSMTARTGTESHQPDSLQVPDLGVAERSANTVSLLVRGPRFVGPGVPQLDEQVSAVSGATPQTAIPGGRTVLGGAQDLAPGRDQGNTRPTDQERSGWPEWVASFLLVLFAPLFCRAVNKRQNTSQQEGKTDRALFERKRVLSVRLP